MCTRNYVNGRVRKRRVCCGTDVYPFDFPRGGVRGTVEKKEVGILGTLSRGTFNWARGSGGKRRRDGPTEVVVASGRPRHSRRINSAPSERLKRPTRMRKRTAGPFVERMGCLVFPCTSSTRMRNCERRPSRGGTP